MANYKPNIQTLPLPITKGVYRNADNEALSDRNYQLYDGYLSETGYHVKRPGLSTFADLGLGANKPVVGLFWWPHKQYVMAVCDGRIFKIEYSGGVATSTDMGGTTLTNGITTTFATDGTYAFFAAGGPILYTNGTAAVAAIADGDAPTTVTHVDWLDGYLLAIDGTNKFYYSDLNTPLAWTATNYFQASGNSDNIVALKVFEREIYLFGSTTTEIWENVGGYPQIFKRIGGGFLEVGCIAPYSVVKTDEGIYWLSDERRISRVRGGRLERISTPYDKEIEMMDSVVDCVGNHIEIDSQPFLIFHFASESRTLVFNMASNTWSEWGYFNTSTSQYERFLGNYVCYAPVWGKYLTGCKLMSSVYEISRNNTTDLGDPIRMSLLTGHIDHGLLKRKKSHELRMRVKSGPAGMDQTPKLQLRWKDNNKNWSEIKEIPLGDIGDTWIVKRYQRAGIYQTRQWEFTLAEPMQFLFGGVEEDVEIIR